MRIWLAAALILLGCGDGSDPSPSGGGPGGGTTVSGPGAELPCPAGELLLDGGDCAGPGIPEDGCSAGFVYEDSACSAIMPSAPCGPGTFALPGETQCHSVGGPSSGPWGDIPTDGSTAFVDASFNGASDGSASAPWTTVQQGVDAATNMAIVAVAAGTYNEELTIDHDVVLWGVGANAVTIIGATGPAVHVDGTTARVRSIALTGGGMGASISDGVDVVFREVWVHDTVGAGIEANGTTSLRIEESLIENTAEYGIAVQDGDVEVVDSSVRDIAPNAGGDWGAGLRAWGSIQAKLNVVVRRSVIERASSYGISVESSFDTIVEDTLVRDVDVTPATGDNGIAVRQQWLDGDGERASLQIRGSVFERLNALGIAVWGGDAIIELTTVRDIEAPLIPEEWGAGIGFLGNIDINASRPTGIVRQSTIDEPHRIGIELWGADVELNRVLVRNPRPKTNGEEGLGVFASSHDFSQEPCDLLWRGGRIEGASQASLTVMGSSAVVDSVAILDTRPNGSGAYGAGIVVLTDLKSGASADAEMSHIMIDGAHTAGIVVGGGDLVVSDVIVRNIDKQANVDDFGDGIVVASTIVLVPGYIPATASITRATIESVPRAGISSFGADVSIGDNLLECNAIALDGEIIEDEAFAFDNSGNNDCGCGAERKDCKVLTTNIEPPSVL